MGPALHHCIGVLTLLGSLWKVCHKLETHGNTEATPPSSDWRAALAQRVWLRFSFPLRERRAPLHGACLCQVKLEGLCKQAGPGPGSGEEISGMSALLGEALALPHLLASIISGRNSIFAHGIGAQGKRERARMGESQRGGPGLAPMALCSLLVLLWLLCWLGAP